jgi:hypothetical protein
MTAFGAPAVDRLNACWPTDNGKPVLDSLVLGPATVDSSSGPVQVTVTAHAHDTGGPGKATGVAHVSVQLESADADSGTTVGPADLRAHLSPAGHGVWTGSVVMPRGTNATYDAYPVVRDHAGLFAGGDLGLRRIKHALDVTGAPDTTRPRVTALTVSTTSVDTRRHSATVRVRGTLRETGARPTRLTMAGPRGMPVTLHRQGTGGKFATTVTIPRRDGRFRWHLSLWAVDSDRNDVGFGHGWLVAHGFPATVAISSGKRDTTAPRVTTVSGLPRKVDARHHTRWVTLRVHAADARGVTAVHAALFGHDAAGTQTRTVTFHRVAGSARAGVWSGRVPVSNCLPGPLSAYAYVRAVDASGNQTEVDRGSVRLLTLDRKPPRVTFHRFLHREVDVRFSEPVHGISAHHVRVLTAAGVVVHGTWTCDDAATRAVSCRRGEVTAATFTPVVGSRTAEAVNWEPNHRLDVLDRAGNPVVDETYAGE